MNRRLIVALSALSLLAAPSARAQFTTVVAPQKKPVDQAAIQEQQRVAQARADTAHRATMQEMSAWVDSVAGVPKPGTVVADSATGDVATDSATVTAATKEQGTTRFRDGARAPNTASPLPILLITGIGMTLLGLGVILTSRRAVPAPARRRRAP